MAIALERRTAPPSRSPVTRSSPLPCPLENRPASARGWTATNCSGARRPVQSRACCSPMRPTALASDRDGWSLPDSPRGFLPRSLYHGASNHLEIRCQSRHLEVGSDGLALQQVGIDQNAFARLAVAACES